MKKAFLKKVFAIALAATISFAAIPVYSVEAAERIDAVELMAMTSTPITRGQFAMLVNTALGFQAADGENFSDVTSDHPYASDLAVAKQIGYMSGSGNGKVNPDAILTGAEASTVISNMLGFDLSRVEAQSFVGLADWAVPAASVLKDLGMVSDSLIAKKSLTVEDSMQFLSALMIAFQFPGSPYNVTQTTANDDFYAYINRQYLATGQLEPGYIFKMAFTDTENLVQKQEAEILSAVLNSSNPTKGSDEWKIKQLYQMYMDNDARTASIAKLQPYFEEIKAVQTIDEYLVLAKKYAKTFDLIPFYEITATADARTDASKYAAILVPASYGLGSIDYYSDNEALYNIQQAYREYLGKLLNYTGETENIEARTNALYEMEKGIAANDYPLEVYSNPQTFYVLSSWDDIREATKTTGKLGYLPELLELMQAMNVYCPNIDYIKYVESLFTDENLSTLKDFAFINIMWSASMMLGDDLSDLSDELQAAVYGQVPEKRTLEQRSQSFVASMMGRAFSRMYAEEYGTDETKSDLTEIVETIRSKFRERIVALDWMSDTTKQSAIEKLDSIKMYIAFPDEPIRNIAYDVTSIDEGGNLIDLLFSIEEVNYRELQDMLSKPVDSNFWESVPTSTVNAFYSPTNNAIVIPLGILQEPFYSKDATREENLGAIGGIIAHEITHAFDNSGAQHDKNGTLTNWWTAEDYESFNGFTTRVAEELSQIKFVGDSNINGVLCTSETVADLGAMACVLDVADDMVGADLEAVMASWATIWRARMSAEVSAYLLTIDVHAPYKTRTNFILSQLDDFYSTYNVTENDGMFTPEEDRIRIW